MAIAPQIRASVQLGRTAIMNIRPSHSGEVESFIAAISDLFWGSKWLDIKALSQQTWTDFNRSGLPWEAVEKYIENGWISRANVGDCGRTVPVATLDQLDLFYRLQRIHRGNASPQDIFQVGGRYVGLIDVCEPRGLTDVGREVLLALQMLDHAANDAVARIRARDRSAPAPD